MIRMNQQEAEAHIRRPEVVVRIKALYKTRLPVGDIAVELGMTKNWGTLVSTVMREIYGDEEFRARTMRINGPEKKPVTAHVKMCGNCREFKPDVKRTGGIRYGICKKSGKVVERCDWCGVGGKGTDKKT